MILRSLRVENFGCLGRGEWSFERGINVVRGPNEAGKSTLAEAVAKVLLGSAPVHTASAEYARWRTWSAAEMYVLEAEFEHGGARWRVIRDFVAGRAELVDLGSGERLTSEEKVRQTLAEMVGLQPRHCEQQYLATAYLRQGEWAAVQEATGLDEVLAQAVLAGGGTSPIAVVRELEKRHLDYARGMDRPAPKNPGAVARAKERVTAARAKVEGNGGARGLLDRRNIEEKARADLSQARETLQKARDELARLRPRLAAATRRRALQDSLDRARERVETVSRVIGRATELDRQLGESQARLAALTPVRLEDVRAVEEKLRTAAGLREQAEDAANKAAVEAKQAEQARSEAEAAMAGAPTEKDVEQAYALDQRQRELEGSLRERERALAEARARCRPARAWSGVLVGAAVLLLVLSAAAGQWLSGPVRGVLGALGALAGLAAIWLTLRAARAGLAQAEQAVADATREHHAASELLARHLRELEANSAAELAQKRARAIERASHFQQEAARAEERALAWREQAEQQAERARTLSGEADEQLAQWGVRDVASARAHAADYEAVEQRVGELRAALDQVLAGKKLADLQAELAPLKAQEQNLEAELAEPEIQAAALSEQEHGELQVTVARLDEEERSAARRVAEAEGMLGAVRGAAAESLVAQEELRAAEEELAAARKREAVYRLAAELMARALEEVRASAQEALLPTAASLLERLTLGRYRQLLLGEAGAPMVKAGGKPEPASADRDLSYATREQVYLALRLGTYLTLWPGEAPPLILDEPLLAFDDERTGAALQVLGEVGAERQVIILTVAAEYDSIAARMLELA